MSKGKCLRRKNLKNSLCYFELKIMFFNVYKKVYPILIYYFVRRVYGLSKYYINFLIDNHNLMKLMKPFYF